MGEPAIVRLLLLFIVSSGVVHQSLHAETSFVWPGNGIEADTPVWGHRDGLRIGLSPTPGPRGLIRIYAPYLQQDFPRVVNFISIEPSVHGQLGRDQSELQMSRDRPGRRGLSFWATNAIDAPRAERPASGIIDTDDSVLRVFIHTEPFENGARPIIECLFRKTDPYEVELVTHAADESAPMTSCVLSATMGSFGLLRKIHLADGRIESAQQLWANEPLDRLGFLPWRTWSSDELQTTSNGRYHVKMSTDARDPSKVRHDPNVAPHWIYIGQKAVHYWRVGADSNPTAAVNGRRTYWMSQSPIPGGTAFENFEIRTAYRPGAKLWFGVRPDP
jgi:hypothetical protein